MMKTVQKILAVVLVLILCAGLLCGCGRTEKKDSEKLSVVVTCFPAWDWVRNVLGSRAGEVELKLLQDSGADLHNYQPSIADIAAMSACDLFVCIGGESDDWVDDALRQASNKNMVVLRLMDALGDAARPEEAIEGAAPEEEEEEEEEEYDEHIWLSPRSALLLCAPIADALSKADPDHAADYRKNAETYHSALEALDSKYAETVDAAPRKVLLFADRYPFLYMVKDYGLTAYAAFSGCSAETEASFEMRIFLTNKVDELGLRHIMVLEGTRQQLAEAIISGSRDKNAEILHINSMQSITKADIDAGVTYLQLMEENLAVLEEALAD